MSMDLILYTACAVSLPADLPESEKWKNYGGAEWAYEADSWQVLVVVDDEFEVPAEALALEARLSVTIPITLEPIGADRSGYQFLDQTVQALVHVCGAGILEGPDGYRRVSVERK